MKKPKIILDKHEFLMYRKEPNKTVWICNNYFNKRQNDRCKVRLITFGREVQMFGHHTHPAKLMHTSHLLSQKVTVVRHNSLGRTFGQLVAEEIDLGVDTKKDILETLAPLLSSKTKPSAPDSRYSRIISNQQRMMKNQSMILTALTRMNRSFREALSKQQAEMVISQPGQATFATPQPTPQSRLFIPNPPSFEFQPISTREELDEFEKNLKDADYLDTFATNMSANCWKSGRQLGLDVCYFLVDLMFTRRFMTICSWTGGSRSSEEKIPFKVYKNTINVFYNLVYEIDSNFTMQYCESFFKAVLKNSVKRCVTGITRCSKIKRRPKNLSYKKKKEMLRKQICQRKEQAVEGRQVVDLTADNENGYKAEY